MDVSSGKSDLGNYAEFAAAFVFEGELELKVGGAGAGRYAQLCKSGAFEGKLLQALQLQEGGKTALIIGLGKKADFNVEFIRRGSALAYKTAEGVKAGALDIILPKIGTAGNPQLETDMAQAAAEGAIIASYPLDGYKSDGEKRKARKDLQVRICGKSWKDVNAGVAAGKIMAGAQNYVRALDEKPGNIVNPAAFAEEAKALARQHGMRIEVLGRKELEKKGMNGILAVGKGSASDPLLVTVEYEGAKGGPLYAVVGKGITFDAGGISLKPSKNMHEMKYDKSGACVVLGVLRAAAEMKLPVRILGVIPLAENMPSGGASRPGDIVTMHSGKTVEILNTDAEGRLILGDALAYAAERKPEAVIDVATLTGAMIVCLGRHAIGLFSNDTKLAAKLKEAGQKTFERVWEMPLWPEYSEMIKGDFADIKNIGTEGEAGSITAAAFLKEFVGETRWAHLDIAGVDNSNGKHPLIEKGATGTGTRLIVQSIIEMSKK